MTTRDRLTLAAALAVALACSALAPLYDGTGWAPETLGAVLLVAAAGAASRRAGLPVFAVPLVQLASAAYYLAAVFAGGTFAAVVVPTGRTVEALQALALQARLDIEALAAPVPSVPSLVLVAVAGAAAVALAVDLLAVGLQRPAVAGLPLLVLLAVPSGLLPGGLGWLPFTLGAAGWLGLLLVEGTDKVGRWGVPLRSAPRSAAGYDPDAGSTGRVGRRIGAAALGVAAFVPALVPGLDARLLPGSGGGSGEDGGPRTTVTYNPVTELQGQLTLPEPRTLLSYRTDDPFPDYLRLTTLDVFDGSQWRSSSLVPDQDVDDGIPVPVGISSGADTRPVATTVEISSLDAQWLPLPPVPSTVEVRGPWQWDADSETVFATRSNTQRVQDYEARSTRVVPTQGALRRATGGDLPSSVAPYAERPNVSRDVQALTEEVTRGAQTPYDAAVALQRFFRDPTEGFTYEEETRNPFDNPDALQTFLEQRQGFCEQYASAMAAMLRVLGIPARVGVGFTPGAKQSDDTWVVSTDDAHAWPEAWFEGAGWVRFEPTPVDDDREIVPDYTEEESEDLGPDATTGPSAEPLPSASAAPEGKDLDQQLERGDDSALTDPVAGGGDGGALPSGRTAAAGLVLLAAVAPALGAALRRRLRWRSPGPLTGWQQLHDDAADVGFRWRPSESPRAAAARLTATRVLPAPAVEALQRLAAGAEQARYARPGPTADGPWREDAATVRAALLRGAGTGARLRAVLAPPSVLRWAGSRTGTLLADVLDRFDDAVGAVGRLVRRRGRAAA